MRNIHPDVLAKLQSQEWRQFNTIRMNFPPTYLYMTDCDVPVLMSAGKEKIDNGSMELDSDWASYNTPTTNERSTTQKYIGDYSRKFTVDAQYEGIRSNNFYTNTGVIYKGSLWVYPDDTTSVRIGVFNGDGSGWPYAEDHTGLTQDAWNEITFSYTETAGGGSAFITMMSPALQTTGSWYVDNGSIQAHVLHSPRTFVLGDISASTTSVVDKTKIKIDNRDDYFTSIFVGGAPKKADITVQTFLLDSSYALVGRPIVLSRGYLDDWKLDGPDLNFSVVSNFYDWAKRVASPQGVSCRWKQFKGTECQYAGAADWCDRTYTRCLALANTANFGGERWLASIVDKEVWWGRTKA